MRSMPPGYDGVCNPKTFKIILAMDRENYRVYTLEDMLPQGFGPANLE